MEETKEPEAIYPSQYEGEVLLKDGSIILVRPIKTDDAQQLLAFVRRLGSYIQYLNLHHISKETEMPDAARFCTVDYNNSFALVAEVLREPKRDIVGIGK